MSVDLGRSDIWIFPKCIPAFTQSIRICKQKEMLDFICFLKLSCFLVYLVDTLVVGKACPLRPLRSSAPRVALKASMLCAHTIYGMCWAWSALIGQSESVVVWCFEPQIVSFFRGLQTPPSSHSLACSYTQHKQTHAFCPSWFLFPYWGEYFLLFSSTSIGTGYPRLSCSFYCNIFFL